MSYTASPKAATRAAKTRLANEQWRLHRQVRERSAQLIDLCEALDEQPRGSREYEELEEEVAYVSWQVVDDRRYWRLFYRRCFMFVVVPVLLMAALLGTWMAGAGRQTLIDEIQLIQAPILFFMFNVNCFVYAITHIHQGAKIDHHYPILAERIWRWATWGSLGVSLALLMLLKP